MYYTVDIIGGNWKAVLKVATDMIARHTIMIKKHPDITHLFSWMALSGVPQSFTINNNNNIFNWRFDDPSWQYAAPKLIETHPLKI